MNLVTCKKCGKLFDYDKDIGICPKCGRFYSTTSYNEEEKFSSNILENPSHDKCSYHGDTMHYSNMSGHDEHLHQSNINEMQEKYNREQLNRELMNKKNEIANQLRNKYAKGTKPNQVNMSAIPTKENSMRYYPPNMHSKSSQEQVKKVRKFALIFLGIWFAPLIVWVIIFITYAIGSLFFV